MVKKKLSRNNLSGGVFTSVTQRGFSIRKNFVPQRPKIVLLSQGNPELQGCAFDCDGRGTDFKKIVKTLPLYAAKTGSHGGDMHFCITQQEAIDLPVPEKLSLLDNVFKEMDY